MKRWSSLSSAVGLLYLFSLNGVTLMTKKPKTTIAPQKTKPIYCLLDNCPADSVRPHYGCNNTENWSPACGKEPKLINITKRIKSYIVGRHNTFRDIVASGNVFKLPPAGRMCKLKWDRDLGDVAKLLVMRCDLRPTNSCISTAKFASPGSNSVFNKFKKKQTAFRILTSQLNVWYDQYKFIQPMTILDGSSLNNSEVGHFLRMMVGPSNRLGCAIAESEKDGWKYQWLTCLYSCSPRNNTVLYEYTSKPGNYCTTGVDRRFQHLCSDKEVVDACNHTPLFPVFTNDTASQIRAMTQKGRRFGGYPPLGGLPCYPYCYPAYPYPYPWV